MVTVKTIKHGFCCHSLKTPRFAFKITIWIPHKAESSRGVGLSCGVERIPPMVDLWLFTSNAAFYGWWNEIDQELKLICIMYIVHIAASLGWYDNSCKFCNLIPGLKWIGRDIDNRIRGQFSFFAGFALKSGRLPAQSMQFLKQQELETAQGGALEGINRKCTGAWKKCNPSTS